MHLKFKSFEVWSVCNSHGKHFHSVSVSNLASALSHHQDKVIESFGGLINIVELCLTHPNASKYININSDQFKQIKKILEDASPTNDVTDIGTDDIFEDHKSDHDSSAVAVQTPQSVNRNHDHNYDQTCTTTLISNIVIT